MPAKSFFPDKVYIMKNIFIIPILTLFVLTSLLQARPIQFHVINGCTNQKAAAKVTAAQGTTPLLPAVRQGNSHYDNDPAKFYTLGDFTLEVPAGNITVRLEKGLLFRVADYSLNVPASGPSSVTLAVYPWIDYAKYGWYPGDYHHHDTRSTHAVDNLIAVFAAESRDFTGIGCYNDGNTYTPSPSAPASAPQTAGFGDASDYFLQGACVSSGQEYIANNFGHSVIMCADTLVQANGANTNCNLYPPPAIIYDQARQHKGFTVYCHANTYGSDYVTTAALRKLDVTEQNGILSYGGVYDMVQTWFTCHNSGRTTAFGLGSDNIMSVGTNMAYIADTLSPRAWMQSMTWGSSFPTDGPLVFFQINHQATGQKKGQGQFVTFPGTAPQTVEFEATALSERFPIKRIRLRQNGMYHQDVATVNADSTGRRAYLKTTTTLSKSAWFCVIVECDSTEAISGAITVMLDRQLPVVRSSDPYTVCSVDDAISTVQTSLTAVQGRSYSTQAQKDTTVALYTKAKAFYTSLISAPPSNDPAPGPVTGLAARISPRTQADYLAIPDVLPAPAQLVPVWN